MSDERPWDGPNTSRITIRCTLAEKEMIEKAASDAGGLSVARYLLRLHYRKEGLIK